MVRRLIAENIDPRALISTVNRGAKRSAEVDIQPEDVIYYLLHFRQGLVKLSISNEYLECFLFMTKIRGQWRKLERQEIRLD